MEAIIGLALGALRSPYGKIFLGMGSTTLHIVAALINTLRFLLGVSLVPRHEVMVQDSQGRWRELLAKGKMGRQIVYPRVFIASVTIRRWFGSKLFMALISSYSVYMLYVFVFHFRVEYTKELDMFNQAKSRHTDCIIHKLTWPQCTNDSNTVNARSGILLPHLRFAFREARQHIHLLGFYSLEDVFSRISPVVIHYTSSLMTNGVALACIFVFGLLFADGLSAKPVDKEEEAPAAKNELAPIHETVDEE